MRTTRFALALAVAAAATAPVALAHPGSDAKGPENGAKAAKGPKTTHHLLHACVTADALEAEVSLKVLGGNRHMRRALDGATALTAKLDERTKIRLVGRARHLPKGRRAPKTGTYADLTSGDRVIVRFRAPRGTAAQDLPAAFRVVDRGPAKACDAPTPPASNPQDEPKEDRPAL